MAVTAFTDGMTRAAFRAALGTNFAQTLNKTASPTAGLYPTTQLHSIPGLGAGTTDLEFLHLGKLAATSDPERLAMPKGLVTVNWSVNLVNNWVWDNAQQRAEPFDVTLPMIAMELGGEGVICHYTAPGEASPSTAFHEINRFGGGVEGLSGVNSLTTHVPFNQFKACIYAAYSSTTTPPAATDESWWGGTGNTLESVLNPLLWLNTEEVKGSGYNLNELAKFSAYDDTAYPVINFEASNGTFDSKTAISTNKIAGKIGSNVYDGAAYQNTAVIDFVTRGTIASGNAGQSIVFLTSATNTAGLASRFEITDDGVVKTFVGFRNELTTVTGIPDYSAFASFVPTTTGSTSLDMRPLSTANGGMLISGLTNVTATAIALLFQGLQGHTAPTAANTVFKAAKHNGTTSAGDLAAGEIAFQFRNNATTLIEILGSGFAGFGVTTPGALAHIGASTTARAGLRVNPGAAPTSPVNGDIWIDSTAHTMHVRINGVTKSIDLT